MRKLAVYVTGFISLFLIAFAALLFWVGQLEMAVPTIIAGLTFSFICGVFDND